MTVAEELFEQISRALKDLAQIASGCADEGEYAIKVSPRAGKISAMPLSADIAYFGGAGEVLAAIEDIVSDPYVEVRREEEIVLASCARPLSPRDFAQTVADGRLWRRKRGGMSPEYVRSSRTVDDFENAENYFIARLLCDIRSELSEYREIYSSAAKRLDCGDAAVGNSPLFGRAFALLDGVYSRAARLMRSSFFLRLSPRLREVELPSPTNVLLDEPRYNKCLRFSVRRHICAAQSQISPQIAACFAALLSARLTSLGFRVEGRRSGGEFGITSAFSSPVGFVGENFSVGLKVDYAEGRADLSFFCRDFARSRFNPVKEEVFFCGNPSPENLADGRSMPHRFVLVSPRGYAEICGESRRTEWFRDFGELVSRYISERMTLIAADGAVYSRICPSCGGRSVVCTDGLYICADCGTEYALAKGKMWLVRRGASYKEGDR